MSTSRISQPANGTWSQRVEDIQQSVQHVPEHMSECVEERPQMSVLALFGAGIVAGVGAVSLYYSMNPAPERTYETYARRFTDAIREAIPQNMQNMMSSR